MRLRTQPLVAITALLVLPFKPAHLTFTSQVNLFCYIIHLLLIFRALLFLAAVPGPQLTGLFQYDATSNFSVNHKLSDYVIVKVNGGVSGFPMIWGRSFGSGLHFCYCLLYLSLSYSILIRSLLI
jgi:hypothetical protein